MEDPQTQQHMEASSGYEKVPISIIANKALVFDLDTIKSLRETDNVLGVLSGTLPVAPQQSIFLSIPLQLSIEEVLYLVSKDRAYLVYEKLIFRQLFESFSTEDKAKYLNDQWEGYKETIGRKKVEIEEKKKLMIAKSKGKKNKKKQKQNKEPEERKEETRGPGNTREREPQEAESVAPVSEAAISEPQDIAENDLNLIFHRIENSSRNFPNYQWLVDNTQKHPGVQKDILYNYVKNYLVSELNDVVRSRQPASRSAYQRQDALLDTFSSLADSVDLANTAINYSVFQKKLQQLRLAVRFIRSLHTAPQTSNYFVSPGLKFGAKFIVYPGDPLRYHSHLIVNFYDYANEGIDLMSIVNGGRLAVGVKKLWVLSGAKNDKKAKAQESNERASGQAASKDIDSFISELLEPSTGPSTMANRDESEVVNFSIEWAGFG